MSWRDQMLSGSFRGAAFLIREARTGFGRRGQVHQFPERDTPYAEDLGRRARSFTVECFVIGADYMSARDALMRACEQPGPGTLVHPYLGVRSVVVVEPAEMTESTAEGGLARFEIPFQESGGEVEPAASTDTAATVQAQASAGGDALATQFADDFSLDGMPQWVQDAAAANHDSLVATLNALRDSIPGIPAAVTAFDTQLAAEAQALASLIRTPYNLGASVVSLIVGLGTIAAQPLDALNLYTGLASWQPGTAAPTGTTPASVQQAANRAAFVGLVQRTAVFQAAAAASQVPAQSGTSTASDGTPIAGYDTSDAAQAVRETLADAIDTQQLTAPDTVFGALTDLRAAVVADLDARAAALPGLVTFTPAADLPALVVAERLYADPTRADEIARRNASPYPGFLAGGSALEVASA